MSDPVPHKPAHSYQPAPQRTVEPGKSSHTILVVDDDSAIRTLVKLWLEMEGYGVLIAADAETAMKLYDPSTVALLLTDVVMPDISGLELADQLLRRGRQLWIFFLCGDEGVSRGACWFSAARSVGGLF